MRGARGGGRGGERVGAGEGEWACTRGARATDLRAARPPFVRLVKDGRAAVVRARRIRVVLLAELGLAPRIAAREHPIAVRGARPTFGVDLRLKARHTAAHDDFRVLRARWAAQSTSARGAIGGEEASRRNAAPLQAALQPQPQPQRSGSGRQQQQQCRRRRDAPLRCTR